MLLYYLVCHLSGLLVYSVALCFCFFFFFKQKTAYEMRISDWSSDVCSSDLAQTIDTIFQRLVLMIIILWILKQGSFSYIMEGFVFPTIGAIMQSAVQLIPGGGAGGCSGGGGGGAAADALVSAGNGLMCAMHVEMGRGMGMGAFLMDED